MRHQTEVAYHIGDMLGSYMIYWYLLCFVFNADRRWFELTTEWASHRRNIRRSTLSDCWLDREAIRSGTSRRRYSVCHRLSS